jgi:hypothetical protein
LLGGGVRGRRGEVGGGGSAEHPPPTSTTLHQPPPTLSERREDLDRLLRQQLESQGIVVRGQDIARAVGAAVGKGIEWQA